MWCLERECSITHAAMTRECDSVVAMKHAGAIFNLLLLAIDVVKTRIQIDPALKGHSLLGGGRKIVAAEGPKVPYSTNFRITIPIEAIYCALHCIGPLDGLWPYSCWVPCPRRREICRL